MNSLSQDGHTLLSIQSPWGVKYINVVQPMINLDIVSNDTYRTKDSNGLKIKELIGSTTVKEMSSEKQIITIQEIDVDDVIMSAIEDINAPKLSNSVFTPYNSTKQNQLWKNWGKDIDWGKVKFQGSDIYTKAQHMRGNEGKQGYQPSFEVIKKDDKVLIDNSLKAPVIDNNLKSSENNLIGNFDKMESKLGKIIDKKKFVILKPVSIRAAYDMAVPQEKDSKKITVSKDDRTIINAVMMVKNIANKDDIFKKENQKNMNYNYYDDLKPKIVQNYEEKTQKGTKKEKFINIKSAPAAEVFVSLKDEFLEKTLSQPNMANYSYRFDDNYDSCKDSASKDIENKEHRAWVETVMRKARIIDYESKHKLRV